LVGFFHFITIKLMVDDANPRADAGQRPNVKIDVCFCQLLQRAYVQPSGRATARQADSAFHLIAAFAWLLNCARPASSIVAGMRAR